MDESTRKAWSRFLCGLKVAPSERLLIIRMMGDMNERVRRAEQAQWNAETYLRNHMAQHDCTWKKPTDE